MRRLLLVLCLVAALASSARLAWQWRHMPHLGIFHDDAIYLVSAHALATGQGYRIESLPGSPWQTKYPILLPLYLSLAWRIEPGFPRVLPWVMLLCWMTLPAFVLAAEGFFSQVGFGPEERILLCFLLAFNPILVYLSLAAMSEVMGCFFFAICLLHLERSMDRPREGRAAILAGLFAGLSILARTALLPVLASAPLCYLLHRRRRQAWLFLVASLPFAAGWQLWTATHKAAASDLETLFYTDYLRFYLFNLGRTSFPQLVYDNLGALLKSFGEMMVFQQAKGFVPVLAALVAAIIGMAGWVRLFRQGRLRQYALFAILFSAQHLVYNFPPTARFLLPLVPGLLAGFWTEFRHILTLVARHRRHPSVAERAVAYALFAVLFLFGLFSLWRAAYGVSRWVPDNLEVQRDLLVGRLPALHWVSANSKPDDVVLSTFESLSYLYTGRRGLGFFLPTSLFYPPDKKAIESHFRGVPRFVYDRDIAYVILSAGDYAVSEPQFSFPAWQQALNDQPVFQRVFENHVAHVYRVLRR